MNPSVIAPPPAVDELKTLLRVVSEPKLYEARLAELTAATEQAHAAHAEAIAAQTAAANRETVATAKEAEAEKREAAVSARERMLPPRIAA